MISKGYTLWLMPTGYEYERFAQQIRELANKYQGPVFLPHVTLLGEIVLSEKEVTSKTEMLVSGQKPFTLRLTHIDYEDFYFRTLFVRAKKTQPLLNLHQKAKEIFGMQLPDYMPHLSLLYGNFPKEIKEKIIKEIGKNQTAKFEVKSVHLLKGGEVEKWKMVAEFPFSIPPPR